MSELKSTLAYVLEMYQDSAHREPAWLYGAQVPVTGDAEKDEEAARAMYADWVASPPPGTRKTRYRLVKRLTVVTDEVMMEEPAEPPSVPDIPPQ